MFIPVKADFKLPRFPFLTALVCIVCAGVFLKQINDWNDYETAMLEFCDAPRSNIKKMVFREIVGPDTDMTCVEVIYGIAESADADATIDRIASEIPALKGFRAEDSRVYVRRMLRDELRNYRHTVPEHPDEGIAYETDSWNPLTMLTSTFAHGSWSHIIFNLIFFIAFAATVEVLAGTFAFVSAFIVIGLAAGVFSSVSGLASGTHFSTVGLSGVVTGMIGLFAYLLPGGKIRCYYWFVIFIGSVAVPAWLLALWYIGGDIYRLFAYEDHGIVNVMAHVSGGIAGYLFGLIFLRKLRWEMRLHQIEANRHALMPGSS
jgi:membrane associated rhomboid family serine protease